MDELKDWSVCIILPVVGGFFLHYGFLIPGWILIGICIAIIIGNAILSSEREGKK